MLPSELTAEQFAGYPPQGKKLAVAYLDTLRQLPLSFLPSLLREIIEYDLKFPAEQQAMNRELAALSKLSSVEMKEHFQGFSQLTLSAKLEQSNWVGQPALFVEQQSAYLWSTHQLDAYRKAASVYGDSMSAAVAPEPPPINRLGIAIVGQGVTSSDVALFRNLRKQGTYFGKINPDNGVEILLNAVATRAKAHPVPYGHWYIEGGELAEHSPLLTCVSYRALEPVRTALLRNMQAEIARPGMGPEELRTHLAQLSPAELGMKSGDAVLNYFELKLFTEGSGTQIFSTTFTQWAAREALRRAQPLTLLVRFGPRQRQRPMNDLLANNTTPELDPAGSLVDADMGAWYNWINQQRLAGADKSSFLVWFEGHGQAVAIGPYLARGTESSSPVNMEQLISWAVS